MKFLHIVGATRRYGDEDVWSYTLNSNRANVEYVHLRDLENGILQSKTVEEIYAAVLPVPYIHMGSQIERNTTIHYS